MGDARAGTAVADSGPLLHLAEVGAIGLMRVFDSILIPDAVWQECVQPGRLIDQDFATLTIARHRIAREDLDRFVRDRALRHLHQGECECLYLCEQRDVSLIMTDDLAVRDAAMRMNLRPVGSLGIVIRACTSGAIGSVDAERTLLELYDNSTLFVTRAIVEVAVEQLHQRMR